MNGVVLMKILSMLVLVILLTSCKSMYQQDKYSDLYLRSEFTWWEAKPEFKFVAIKDSTNKVVRTKIEADGSAYHIKVADKIWSKYKNCGYKNNADRIIKLDKWLELECTYDFDKLNTTPIQKPFQIKPTKDAFYTFTLKMTTTGPSHIKISKE
jgi:hypothetical protein